MFFLIETFAKANTASLHSVRLYYDRFGRLFVEQHFAILKTHRFL